MNLNAELLQFYRCKSLRELMERSATAFSVIGFPHLVLKWSPAAASRQKMLENSAMIWSNFEASFGARAVEISRLLEDSISIGLAKARENTLERQTWRLLQHDVYQLRADAPKAYFLTSYQQSLIREFGEVEWAEFMAFPLARERERTLVLEAKTQRALTEPVSEDARAIFFAFACVYQCLHHPIRSVVAMTAEDRDDASLSRREVQCLHWLAAGKTYSEAATILDISERTLRFHVGNAKQKLGVSTTMQAVVSAALEYGFDPKDPRQSIYYSSRRPAVPDVLKAG